MRAGSLTRLRLPPQCGRNGILIARRSRVDEPHVAVSRASQPKMSTAVACEWVGYIAEDFRFGDFPAGSRVLDIGFGSGEQLRGLASRGCRGFGLEIDPQLAASARRAGRAVCRAGAEALPFTSNTFDGVICKVVIPYTDEAQAVAEIARVLRPGGVARVSYHGMGYFLRYLLTNGNWKLRVYGARALLNSAVYTVTGCRLPAFWGDTLYQSRRRLERYYRRAGLSLVEERPSTRFAGAPVFIYHVLTKGTKDALPER